MNNLKDIQDIIYKVMGEKGIIGVQVTVKRSCYDDEVIICFNHKPTLVLKNHNYVYYSLFDQFTRIGIVNSYLLTSLFSKYFDERGIETYER